MLSSGDEEIRILGAIIALENGLGWCCKNMYKYTSRIDTNVIPTVVANKKVGIIFSHMSLRCVDVRFLEINHRIYKRWRNYSYNNKIKFIDCEQNKRNAPLNR